MISSRIEDLRRRVDNDPASIAFAQLAEEYRRAGRFQESVDVCRAGLDRHPGYLSARVTLGRALVELGRLDEAQPELEAVLRGAPENLSALRGLAEIQHRRGNLSEALDHYETALGLARNDPDLQETVHDLAKKLDPHKAVHGAGGLSYDQVKDELSAHVPRPPAALTPMPARPAGPPPASADDEPAVAALEGWLHAIHVTRADRRP